MTVPSHEFAPMADGEYCIDRTELESYIGFAFRGVAAFDVVDEMTGGRSSCVLTGVDRYRTDTINWRYTSDQGHLIRVINN